MKEIIVKRGITSLCWEWPNLRSTGSYHLTVTWWVKIWEHDSCPSFMMVYSNLYYGLPTNTKSSSTQQLFHETSCERQKNAISILFGFMLNLCVLLCRRKTAEVNLLPILEFIFSCMKKPPKATIRRIYDFLFRMIFLVLRMLVTDGKTN